MSSINFDNAYLLLIALPLIALFTLPFALAVNKDNRNGHNIASEIMHIVLAVLVAFTAAGTNVTTVLTETQVIVVADVSFSAHKNLDTVDNYIKDIDLPQNSKMGVVAFGKDAEYLYELGSRSDIGSVKDNHVDDSETNIAEALRFAGELFSDSAIKRIVLITDGKQTDESNAYAIRGAVDELQTQGVKVDAIFLDDNIPGGVEEVQISGGEYTPNVYLGKEEAVNLTVQSSYDVNAILTVYRDGAQIEKRAEALTEGVNNITISLDTSEGGTFGYEVVIEAQGGDESGYNNSYSFTQTVTADFKALIVTEVWKDAYAAYANYGDNVEIDLFINNETNRPTDITSAELRELRNAENVVLNWSQSGPSVPCSVEDLNEYDEIVLMDVDINHIKNYPEFISSLDKVVSLFGKSLVTAGNLNLSIVNTEESRQLQDMLPVRYGNNEEDPKLYTLVIDASRSMEQVFHLIIAKQVATRLVDLMNEYDEICVLAFSGEIREIQQPERLSRVLEDGTTVRESVMDKINNLGALQGTLIGAGLNSAYEHIKDLAYSDKQVMLITDGLSFGDEPHDPAEVASRMFADGIVTSVFDVGRLGSEEESAEMVAVSRAGGGGYFFSPNLEDLNEVTFAQAAETFTGQVAPQGEYGVTVGRLTDDVLDGIEFENRSLPAISSYVYGNAKASATTVLSVEYKTTVNGDTAVTLQKPLYAYWNYGNGKVSTFTSSAADNRLASWESAGISDKFLGNVYSTSIPDENVDSPYVLQIMREGKNTRLELTPSSTSVRPGNGMAAEVTITSPDGTTATENMIFDASYFYLNFESADAGKYDISIKFTIDGHEYVSDRAMHISFTGEYDAFAVYEASLLHRAIDGRGTVSHDGKLELTNNENEVGRYTVSLTIPLLIACVVLFVVDIAVRKLKWNDIKSFFGIGKKKGGAKK